MTRARNVRGGGDDPARGSWCTEKRIADAVGHFDLDPFSNPRSHIQATRRCMLEDGGDGLASDSVYGVFRVGGGPRELATPGMSVWLQPPYSKGFVERAIKHYEHTRWVALLRFDPRPPWFKYVYRRARMVCVLTKCNFEPPPGVSAPGSTFPHAIFYRYAEDVTPDVLRITYAWRK